MNIQIYLKSHLQQATNEIICYQSAMKMFLHSTSEYIFVWILYMYSHLQRSFQWNNLNYDKNYD